MWRSVLLVSALLGGAVAASAQAPPGPLPASLGRAAPLPSAAATVPAAPTPGGATTAAAPPAAPEALQSFDSNRAEVQWTGGRWQVVAGGVVLKDFGARQEEARTALRLMRQLRLTQHGTVGAPRPVMEYWLADGRAPQGLVRDLHPLPLDPNSLRVEQVQGQWAVRDNTRVLFTFGARADEARQALAVIQRHGFTQVGVLGPGVPDMLVFLGGPARLPASAQMASPAFSRVVPPAHEPGPAVRQAGFSAAETNGGIITAGLSQPAAPAGAAGDAGPPQPFAPAPLPSGRQLTPASPPASDPPLQADRTPLDWQQVEVRQDGNDWKLVAGNATLANFGPHDTDARLALNAIRYYHFTEHGTIGSPRPLFSYFLTNGQAPRGYMLGVEHVTFHPDSLAVRQAADAWTIYDGNRALLNFGDRPDEARQALAVIRHYQFDTLCRVGHADTGVLTFFVRAR